MLTTRSRDACAAALAAAALLFVPFHAWAGTCGDDVDGTRVPCACGDVVVSDTILRAGDPVVTGRCPADGLFVRAPALAETITLDLAGLALVGSGVGVGIDVHSGGSDGAVITGGDVGRRGQIVGYSVGLKVRSGRAARRIQHLELRGQVYEGMDVRAAGTIVVDVHASRNGGDGIRVSGQGGRLLGIRATENAGAGLRVVANNVILSAAAQANRSHGVVITGTRNDLRDSRAAGNGGHGFLLAGRELDTTGISADANALSDIGYRKDRGPQ